MGSLYWRQSTSSRTSSDDSLYLPLENHRSNQRQLFSGRNASDDSLYVPVNNRQTIKRWNGIAREAMNWNSLPRDPELFFPTGNCLVYLYPAGHSQRGPSFRIPYHVLQYSGCQPLVQQCLISTLNVSSLDRNLSKALSYGTVGYSVSDDTRTYLYLYPPAGLSRDESYSYHITTRNFFAWLLGVPLVGVDPVTALLDLKARMDLWRDPNANNFEAVFEYARQQAYGDFEEIQIEMDKRIELESRPERYPVYPSEPVQALDRRYRHNASIVRRNDSLQQRLRSTVSRTSGSHIALQDRRVEQTALPVDKRQSLPRLTTFPVMPALPSSVEIDKAIRRMSGLPTAQSSNAVSPIQAGEPANVHQHTSSSTSVSPISPISPIDSNGIDAALQRLNGHSSAESVVTVSNSQTSKANKKKHRVSWADNNPTVAEARSSQTDLTYPNMQGIGLQSAQASSSAINVSQPSPVTRRSLSSRPLSSNAAAGPSKRASTPASSAALPSRDWGRVARPMSTASLISIPTLYQTSPPFNLEPCSCCGKIRRPDTARPQQQQHANTSLKLEPCTCCGKMRRPSAGLSQHPHLHSRPTSAVGPCSCCGKTRRPNTSSSQQHQQSRPASIRSMKSFRSTKSWRSLRSIRSSLSLGSLRSSLSLSSFRSYFSRKSAGNKSFRGIQASMKDRRNAFRKRVKDNKKKDLKADPNNFVGTQNGAPACDPNDYASLGLKSRYQRDSHSSLNLAPVELEAEPVAMKTVPEMTSSDSSPWSPDSYSDFPPTPPEDRSVLRTTIRPKEIYTSSEYRQQPAPRRTADVNHLRGLSNEDLDPDSVILDIGTPGGFEDDFVDTLIAQLEAAGIGERLTSANKGKGKARTGDVYDEEGDIWMGMKSSVGVPKLELRAMG